jgi:hypothetical protein
MKMGGGKKLNIIKLVVSEGMEKHFMTYDNYMGLVISIDGKDLIETVKAYELKLESIKDKDLAGAYAPEYAKWLYRDLLPDWHKNMNVLICPCGVVDCWPVTMSYYKTKTLITWYGFHQPWQSEDRPGQEKWDYSNFGSFTFDRKQYEDELKKVYDILIQKYIKKEIDEFNKLYQDKEKLLEFNKDSEDEDSGYYR